MAMEGFWFATTNPYLGIPQLRLGISLDFPISAWLGLDSLQVFDSTREGGGPADLPAAHCPGGGALHELPHGFRLVAARAAPSFGGRRNIKSKSPQECHIPQVGKREKRSRKVVGIS